MYNKKEYIMKKICTILLLLITCSICEAQNIKKKSYDISIGLGVSVPYDNSNTESGAAGFYLEGEYVFDLSKWVDIRPYAGLILVRSDNKIINTDPAEFEVKSNAFLIGGKTRVKIPIPWVAPFVEVGIGASIGSFRTFTPLSDIDESGIIYHIPFSIGFELGRKQDVEIVISYYVQPKVAQAAGALAFGVSIPLKVRR